MRLTRIAALLAVLATACGEQKPAPAPVIPPQTVDDSAAPALVPVTPADYSAAGSWLCRPEISDACEQSAIATSISADGKLTKDRFAPAANPPIDCFYVYSTVSNDETPNSDLNAGSEETEIARQQVARFGSVCKIYAPMYRQVTLPALRKMLAGEDVATNREMAYADIKAAWDRYIASDNAGRGVVLIGHSQGAGLLTRLIASEIDGKPAQDRLVLAVLLGSNLSVGADGAGSFKEITPCVSSEDVGCVISYTSFRTDAPPDEDSLFGKAGQQGMKAVCVNPAELDGSNGQLKAILPAGKVVDSMAPPGAWTTDNPEIETPFVMLPGMLSAQCVDKGGFNYLAVSIAADPADKRTDAIVGDVVRDGNVLPGWGLHLIDMHLAMGNLVDVVASEAKAYASREISRIQHPREDP